MNLDAGLMALANFGTGYQQGQRNAIADHMQKLQLANAQQKQAENQRNMDYQRMESDNAMKSFLPKIAGVAGPGQPTSGSTQPPPVTGNEPQFGTPEWFMQQGKYAASIGDLTHATQMATDATNATLAQFTQAQKQSAIQNSEFKRQAQSYKNVAQILGDPTINGAANPAQEFHRRLLAILSDPNVSPEEKKNLQGLQYSPQIVDQIGTTGMTAAQKASQQLQQMRMQQEQQHQQVMESIARQKLLATTAHWAAQQRDKLTAAKTGKAGAAITSNEHMMAVPVVQQMMGSSYKEGDPDSELAVITIASRAKQIVNRPGSNVSYAEALNIAAQEAKRLGEFKPTKVSHLFGADTLDTKDETFEQPQGTKANPIPVEGLTQADLVPGQWYSKDGQLEQYKPKK